MDTTGTIVRKSLVRLDKRFEICSASSNIVICEFLSFRFSQGFLLALLTLFVVFGQGCIFSLVRLMLRIKSFATAVLHIESCRVPQSFTFSVFFPQKC
jgi:hypothetical protein